MSVLRCNLVFVYNTVKCSVHCGALFRSSPCFIYDDSELDRGSRHLKWTTAQLCDLTNWDSSRLTINHSMCPHICG